MAWQAYPDTIGSIAEYYTANVGDTVYITIPLTSSDPSIFTAEPAFTNETFLTATGGGTAMIIYDNPSFPSIPVYVTGAPPPPPANVITGYPFVAVGETTQLYDTLSNGVWVSSDVTVATVSLDGLVTGIKIGTTTVTYTNIDGDASVLVTVTPDRRSNGFELNKVVRALSERVGWRELNELSKSGRFFEDFHPMTSTSILEDVYTGTDFTGYITSLKRSVIMEALNSIYNMNNVVDGSKLCFYRQDVPLAIQIVTNSSMFVGLKMNMAKGDYGVKFNSVELFFTADCTIPLYLFNDMQLSYLKVKDVQAQAYNQTIVDLDMEYILNNLTPNFNKGGRWYLGYFQDDIQAQNAQAIYYNILFETFRPCSFYAFSAPVVTDILGNPNFNRNNIGANNLSYGMNLEVTTFRDPTNNVVQNAQMFDELIGLMMTQKCIEQIIYSYRNNDVQRNLQTNEQITDLYRELNQSMPTEEIPFTYGIKKQIERTIVNIKKSLQDKPLTYVGVA